MNRRPVFISRNYKHSDCAGSIAKRDIEIVMERLGFTNIGLDRTFYRNGIMHGVRNGISLIKGMLSIRKGDVIVLQYPMKKGYERICRIAKKRGARVISLLIDLAAFREKEITPERETELLNLADVVLTHNHNMRRWLKDHGCTSRLIDYEVMDYVHGESGEPHYPADGNYSLYYVGNLDPKENGFLYDLAELMPERDIYLYGHSADMERLDRLPNLHLEGMAQDTALMKNHKGDFGISWYGRSLGEGVGKYGEYMNVNNPHKVSLYLRCNSPVVAWHKAGRAEFIERERLGITVGTLNELNDRLNNLDRESYTQITDNVRRVNGKIKQGKYLEEALGESFAYLDTLP